MYNRVMLPGMKEFTILWNCNSKIEDMRIDALFFVRTGQAISS